ncbi:alpha/beta hydrolase family protein, partial [Sphingopyxis sp.]|uniref:alpha/beta hydrolase family protein n=1 Tax=Sphingopyxis sp. TaxID=1908224 RepID=UPI002F068393
MPTTDRTAPKERRLLRNVAIPALMAVSTMAPPAAAAENDCALGTYRAADGEVIDVAASDEGALRWRSLDGHTGELKCDGDHWTGTTGWTGRRDGLQVRFDCAANSAQFGERKAQRIALEKRETSFTSHGTRLVGRLVLPPGDGPVPVVVLLHGSEPDSARDFNSLQRMLPAAGVGAFVYDKRGTGASGDKYTQVFSLLADDAVAAL